MPESRSAPNRRCAVPGTPIMPAPSRFTSATGSMLVMPFDFERGDRIRANQGAALLRRERVADEDRNVARNRRLHGLRMNDLGAEIRQFHRLVVRELIDDLRVRHQPRIGRQHAVDIGPDDDFDGIEQRAEYGPRKIAAVAAQRGLLSLGRGRDEAGDDEPAA